MANYCTWREATEDGERFWYEADCSSYTWEDSDDYIEPKYCPQCGQPIMWVTLEEQEQDRQEQLSDEEYERNSLYDSYR